LWAVQIPHIVGPFITIVIFAGWRLTFAVNADADLHLYGDLASGVNLAFRAAAHVPEFGLNVFAIWVVWVLMTAAPTASTANRMPA